MGTGEARLRPSSEIHEVPTRGWTGSVEPYKPSDGEVGESGAGVGAAHSTEETRAAERGWREGAALGLCVWWREALVSADEARTTRDKARDLQRTLYRAAKASPERRFHALYDKVYREDVLATAWQEVKANAGAAGVDQRTIDRAD